MMSFDCLKKLFPEKKVNWETAAKEQIKINEGLKLKVYKCPAGKLTIGYGHNLEDNGITLGVADVILAEDFNNSIKYLEFVFGKDFFNSLSSNVKIALTDMMFNLGLGSFMTFQKFIKAIKEKDFERAAEEVKYSKAYIQCRNRYEKISKQIKEG